MPRQNKHPDQLVSLREGASTYQISVKTLRRRIADGTITGYKVGRLVRVDPNELATALVSTIPTLRNSE
jgi:excisionase family DNA binding protein